MKTTKTDPNQLCCDRAANRCGVDYETIFTSIAHGWRRLYFKRKAERDWLLEDAKKRYAIFKADVARLRRERDALRERVRELEDELGRVTGLLGGQDFELAMKVLKGAKR